MASELHDSAGALLSTTRLYLQLLRLQPQSPEAKDWLKMAESLVGDTVQTIRSIAQNMQPSELESIGLAGALRSLTDLVAGSGQLEVETTLEDVAQLSGEAQLLLYRMAQELVGNAIKHVGQRRYAWNWWRRAISSAYWWPMMAWALIRRVCRRTGVVWA